MLYTGLTRSAGSVLEEQNDMTKNGSHKKKTYAKMVKLAWKMKSSLEENKLDEFGDLLHQNWELKKQLANGISNGEINKWYEAARKNGAIGGKILGAGGGGFLLVYAPKDSHPKICKSLPDLRPIDFHFDSEGSKILFYEG